MTTKNRPLIRHCSLGLALAASLGLPHATHAAPGDLAQLPLFLGTNVPPNIFFVLDDSGSMDWEVLQSPGAMAAHEDFDNWGLTTQPPSSEDEILELCAGYNVLAYDPSVTYTPWEGVDSDGIPFGDKRLSGIHGPRDNPIDPDSTVDVDTHIYFVWTDSDGDGDYDIGECPRPDPADYGGSIDATDCGSPSAPGPAGCVKAWALEAADQTNFANWYTYYRKREYVQKRAVSAAIDGSRARMGAASLHDTGNVSTPISDMSDTTSDSACGAGITNKECLLRNLFQLDAAERSPLYTPLRNALDQAGRYFDDTDAQGHEFLGAAPSPILPLSEGGDCQQNFAVVVSDGYWNQPWPEPPATSHGDADSGTDAINSPWDGGAQADGVLPLAVAPTTCEPLDYWPENEPFPFPTRVDTLADIAMHYYEKDLSALDENVNTLPGVDENPQQHMVTFTVAFGVDGNLTTNPPNREDPFDWPPICPDTLWTVDDLRHAAWNGRGQFLSARSPTSVSHALSHALAAITQRQATRSALAFNTSSLSTNTLIFQATLNSENWSGDLLAYDAEALMADIDADGVVDIDPVWRATEWLDRLSNDLALQRVVLTRGATGDGVAASTFDDLSAAQQTDLRTNSAGVQDADAVGQGRLNYLLGDRSCEVGGDGACAIDINGDGSVDNGDKSLRQRASRLGDIVNAGPLFVGAPELDWPSTPPFPDGTGGTTAYTDFKTALTDSPRTEVVYVGANDGMLHGFRTSDGQEVLAYLPSSLASDAVNDGYHRLSDPQYTHRFYVDRTPAVSDAYIPPTAAGTASWRTVAVGGLGAGGRGLYALDITDPISFNAGNAGNAADILLWELTGSDDPELGFTVSKPIVAMMNNGEWAAIVGSGYNDTGDADAYLFIVFLEGGLDGSWTVDSDYIKIAAPEPTATLENRNGMTSPAVADLDGNGTADRIYAGDLFGNMWAFDVSDSSPANWDVASGEDTSSSATTGPLFTAELAGLRQPITHKPVISKHPTRLDTAANEPNVMVYFGTGQYLVDSDPSNMDPQSFYGVWDRGVLELGRGDLLNQEFDSRFANNEVLEDVSVNWPTQFGWYIDLPDSGERVVVDPVLRAGILFFNSLVPSTSECAGGGSGFLYAVDMENGGRPGFQPFSSDTNDVIDVRDLAISGDDTEVMSRDAFEGGMPSASKFLDDRAYTGVSDTGIDIRVVFPLDNLDRGRLSWQELNFF